MGSDREPAPDVIGTADADRPSRRWPRYAQAGGALVLAGIVVATSVSSLGHHRAASPPSGGTASPLAEVPVILGTTPPKAWALSLNVATWPVEQLTTGPSSGGVFALGVAGYQSWQLALRGRTRAGQGCTADVTLNGTDAFPIAARPAQRTQVGDVAFIALSLGARGVGVAFVQAAGPGGSLWLTPGLVGELVIRVPVVTASACGRQYYLAGFAYPLDGTLDIWATPGGPHPAEYQVPEQLSRPAALGAWQTGG